MYCLSIHDALPICYKHPEHLVLVDTLPRNQFGKVIKKDLRRAFG